MARRRKVLSEMGDATLPNKKNGQDLLTEPEDGQAPQTTDLESGEMETGDKVDVYGADDIDKTDSLDDGGSDDSMGAEGAGEVDLDSEIDFDGEGDDIKGGGGDPEELVHDLASALSAIMRYGDKGMSSDEAMAEAYKQIIGEDASETARQMEMHSTRRGGAWQPDDFRTLGEQLVEAAGDSYTPRDLLGKIHNQRLYHIIETSSQNSGVKIIEVINVYEAKDRAAAHNLAKTENRLWKDRYSDVAGVDQTNEELQGLDRQHMIKNPEELRQIVTENSNTPNRFIFCSEGVKQKLNIHESRFGLKGLIEGDAKSISNKTRKTHSIDNTSWAGMYDAAIQQVKKAASGGVKQAPKRHGDKSNADKMQQIQDYLRQASGKQIAALWKASYKAKPIREAANEAITYTFSNEVEALCNVNEGMTDSQRDAIKVIFENAVKDKVNEALPVVITTLEERKREEVDVIQESIVKRMDSYLDFVVDNFMNENKVAIEQGIQNELSESFMSGLKELFHQHYVKVPENKEDILESVNHANDKLSDRLEDANRRAMSYKKKAVDMFRENTTYRLSKGLSDNQTAKLFKLLESVEFDTEDEFLMKARQIKETYFGQSRPVREHKEEDYATLVEQVDDTVSSPSHGSTMNKYVDAINRMS